MDKTIPAIENIAMKQILNLDRKQKSVSENPSERKPNKFFSAVKGIFYGGIVATGLAIINYSPQISDMVNVKPKFEGSELERLAQVDVQVKELGSLLVQEPQIDFDKYPSEVQVELRKAYEDEIQKRGVLLWALKKSEAEQNSLNQDPKIQAYKKELESYRINSGTNFLYVLGAGMILAGYGVTKFRIGRRT